MVEVILANEEYCVQFQLSIAAWKSIGDKQVAWITTKPNEKKS